MGFAPILPLPIPSTLHAFPPGRRFHLRYVAVETLVTPQMTSDRRLLVYIPFSTTRLFNAIPVVVQRLRVALHAQLLDILQGPRRVLSFHRGTANEQSSIRQVLYSSGIVPVDLFSFRCFAVTCANDPTIPCWLLPNAKNVLFDRPCDGLELRIVFPNMHTMINSCGARQHKRKILTYQPRSEFQSWVSFIEGVVFKEENEYSRHVFYESSAPPYVFTSTDVMQLSQKSALWLRSGWTGNFQGMRVDSFANMELGNSIMDGPPLRLAHCSEIDPCAYSFIWRFQEKIRNGHQLSSDELTLGKMRLTAPFEALHGTKLVSDMIEVLKRARVSED